MSKDQVMRQSPPSVEEFLTYEPSRLIERYAIGVERFDKRVFELTDALLDTALLASAGAGRWPVRVLLGHLADADLVLSHRMRRVVAEENPLIAAWDEDAFIDAGVYAFRHGGKDSARSAAGAFVATIHTLRAWTTGWLQTLQGDAWDRKAMHSELGEMTLKLFLVYAVWHHEHHAAFLPKKVELLTGGSAAGRV